MQISLVTTSIRNFRKNRVYALLNITGLAIGVASSLLIFVVIHFELSYDRQQANYDRIYRVVSTYQNRKTGEITAHQSAVPIVLPDAMRNDFPQLEKVAAVWNIGGAQIHIPGKNGIADERLLKKDEGLYFTDPSLYEMFDFTWLEGNALGLKDPNTVVLSQSMAKDFFGDWQSAVGHTIQLWSFRVPLKIIGIFRDLPGNTDMEVRMGASYATFRQLNAKGFSSSSQWGNVMYNSQCFVMLPRGIPDMPIDAQFPAFIKKYYPPDQSNGPVTLRHQLQPLKGMHLNEDFSTFKSDALSYKELWALAFIGIFLVLVACINFINLATAQSVNRAKEIGVRKVLGSGRGQLLGQFLRETAVLTLLSLVLGFILAWLAIPYLSNLMGKPLSLNLLQEPAVLVFLVVTGVLVTFLAGVYPGIVLSRFNPIDAIRSKISTRTIGGISLRRGLVVLQFVIAQLLIIGTLVVLLQMRFFQNRPMGFDKKAVAFVELPSDSLDKTKYDYLKSSFLQLPGISSASLCMDAPASFGAAYTGFYFDTDPILKEFNIAQQFADSDYLKTFRIDLAAGRIPYRSDTVRELMVNQVLVHKLGLRNDRDIIGKTISFDGHIHYPVVGVVHDFNSKSLRDAVEPMVITTNRAAANYLAFRLDTKDMKTTLAQVQKTFIGTFPYYLYDLTFMDDRIDHFYTSEARISKLFAIFAGLAIAISCLGLYGLISFMAVQKTREVGVRKVLGASVQSIVYLFSKEFTILVGIAFFIAAPVGYYFMNQWLQGFHYHIPIGAGVFLLTLTASVVIAWLTVGYKAVRAAVANPVKNLRTE